MKFSTRQDIEAPVDYVFARATDFAGFEKKAVRRGIEVARIDDLEGNAIGMHWDASFTFRGKARKIAALLTTYDTDSCYVIQSKSGGVDADLTVDFIALSRSRTRIIVGLDLRPTTMSSRLLVQSLKFAKANLYSRFEARVKRLASEIEEQYGRGGGMPVQGR